MSTKIRLRRMGKKKQPFYRIVVADSRNARDGRAIEEIGTYNPLTQPGRVSVKEDRVFEWLRRGAEPSDTVGSLFRRIGVMHKWSLHQAGQDTSGIELKTELTETIKPKGRAKKAKAAEVESAPAEAEAAAAVTEDAPEAATEEPAEASEPAADEAKSE